MNQNNVTVVMIFKIVLNFKEKYYYIVDEMTKSEISFEITQ